MSYTTVVICRHGETDANVNKILSGGNSDHLLNEKGKKDAVNLGQYLKVKYPEGFDAYYSSDLSRSKDTARLAFGDVPIIALRKLQEIRHGKTEEIHVTKRQEAWQKFVGEYTATHPLEKRDPFYKWNNTPFAAEGAETVSHLQNRVTKALVGIAKEHTGKKVVIVAHGALLQSLMMLAQVKTASLAPESDGFYPMFFEKPSLPNCAVASFKISNEDGSIEYLGCETSIV